MKTPTENWLHAALVDLRAAELLLMDEGLTTVVAFHSQQAIEKSLKAALEELETDVPKVHTLVFLYKKVCAAHMAFPAIDDDLLRSLDLLYIDARYPGNFGYLPDGPPTGVEAHEFYTCALTVYRAVSASFSSVPEI